MFAQFHGLPVHALVLHVAICLAPLAALVGLLGLLPRWRARLQRPFVVLSALAVATVYVAKESGEVVKAALRDQLVNNPTGRLVAEHQRLGNQLLLVMIALLVLAVGAAVLRSRVDLGRFALALTPLVAVVAAAALVLTYQTGEAGAKARWNPDSSFDYSGK